jgi:hypothetical protein
LHQSSIYMSPQAKAVYSFFLTWTWKRKTDKNPTQVTFTSTRHTHVHACIQLFDPNGIFCTHITRTHGLSMAVEIKNKTEW